MAPFRVILAATDFSPGARQAVSAAVDLAAAIGARLHLVHAFTLPSDGISEAGPMLPTLERDLTDHALRELEQAALRPRQLGCMGQLVLREGTPRDVILSVADELGADLIVVGTEGRQGVARAVLGSVAERVLRQARCPVLAVRVQPPVTVAKSRAR